MSTVLFHCEACGLETPGRFTLPDLPQDYPNPIVLSNECGHCDAPLERTFTLPELKREIAGSPPWYNWYAQARDKAKEYGLRGIPKDTYREHWLMGASVDDAVQQIRLQLDPLIYQCSARGDHR